MSLVLNGTSQYLSLAAALATATPLTFFAWVKPTSLSGTDTAVGIGNAASGSNLNRWTLETQVSVVAARTGNTTGSASATAGSATVGAWHAIAAVFAAANSRTACLGGVAGTTNTSNRVPADVTTTTVGAIVTSAGGANFLEAKIAEVAIWSAVLTGAEVASLAAGTPPSAVQPGSLLAYLPLRSDILDAQGNVWTNNDGATLDAADHPVMASAGLPAGVLAHLNRRRHQRRGD